MSKLKKYPGLEGFHRPSVAKRQLMKPQVLKQAYETVVKELEKEKKETASLRRTMRKISDALRGKRQA